MKRFLLWFVSCSVLTFAGCEEAAPAVTGMDAMGTDGGIDSGEADVDASQTTIDASQTTSEIVDECVDAMTPSTQLGRRVFAGSTATATHQPRPSCNAAGPDMSMRWAAPSTGTFVFDTRDSMFDTVLDVRAACTGASLACNDDGPSLGTSSEVRLRLSAGDTVVIFVDGYGANDSGEFVLNIRVEADFDAGVDAGPDAGQNETLDAGQDGGRTDIHDAGVDVGVDAGLVCRADQRECEGRCSTCPTTGVLAAECSGNRCVAIECESGRRVRNGLCEFFTCSSGQRACGSMCAACPMAGVATTACSGDACVAATCRTDWVLRDGICEPGMCEATERFCGDACATCPTTGIATTTCSASSCVAATCMSGYRLSGSGCSAFTCLTNQRACGSACATCPTIGVASTTCDASGSCVAASCATDYELVDGACQPIACGAGQRSCGGMCRTCPTDGVATTTCSGPACIAASCSDGYGPSGGACTPRTCATGSLYCSSGCATCPTVGASTFGCVGLVCEARTCAPDYVPTSHQGRTRCVDASWTWELVSSNATEGRTSPEHSAVVALGPTGDVYVGYVEAEEVVIARREATGWTRVGVRRSGANALESLSIDRSGNAHVLFYQGSPVYDWSYLRISPSGAASLEQRLGNWGFHSFALAVDSFGDAHVVRNDGRTRYRRTYLGAWQPEITIGSMNNMLYPAIAVDAAGDVHIAGISSSSGGRVYYTKSSAGIFPEPIGSAMTVSVTSLSSPQLLLDGSTVEYWLQSSRNFYRSIITGGTPSNLSVWGALTGSPSYVSGGRGPNGFAMLEQSTSNGAVTFRAGSSIAPSVAEDTNLPIQRVLPGLVYDSAGHVHALGRREHTSSSRMQLYYLRRE